MKKICLIIIFVCFAQAGFAQYTKSELAAQSKNLDTLWNNKQYTQIITLINSKLQSNSSDMFYLLTKMNYFLYIDYNLQEAKNAATTAKQIIQNEQRTELQPIIDEIVDPIIQAPSDTTGSRAINQQEHDVLHDLFDRYPDNLRSTGLSLVYYNLN